MNLKKVKNLDDLIEAIKDCKSPLDAIRLKCLDCVCYEHTEVENCDFDHCPLFPFRRGENPYSKHKK